MRTPTASSCNTGSAVRRAESTSSGNVTAAEGSDWPNHANSCASDSLPSDVLGGSASPPAAIQPAAGGSSSSNSSSAPCSATSE